MGSSLKIISRFHLSILWIALAGVVSADAGVSQAIQDQYKRSYENKAMFLKIPMYTDRQVVNIEEQTLRMIPDVGSPVYKVGDQFRITRIDFSGNEIKFRLGGITTQAEAEIIFRFPADLQENFPRREVFDSVLQSTFTEGLRYTDIEDAKTKYLEEEFDRSVNRIASAASLSRDVVLEKVAPLVPDYRKAASERDELKAKVENISTQLDQVKSDSLKLETKVKERENELSRVQSTNATVQKKLDDSESRIIKLEAELRDAQSKARRFEREIETIQSSLNVEADSNRDLSRNNAELADRIRALQTDLGNQQSENTRLTGEIEGLKDDIKKKNSTIRTLTSNKDSIGRQYVTVKEEKEKLDEFALAVHTLQSRIVGETLDGGFRSGKAGIFVKDVLLGYLEWNIPSHLNHDESGKGQATFSAESIDDVKVTPEERQLLRTLGERLKIRLDLASLDPSVEVRADDTAGLHELGEREDFTWTWDIHNKGTEDSSILLSGYIENKNADEIPLFQKEFVVASSNPIRVVRSYLQPVPMAIGVILGFLLFGIIGIFRRPKSRKQKPPSGPPAASKPYVNEKKL